MFILFAARALAGPEVTLPLTEWENLRYPEAPTQAENGSAVHLDRQVDVVYERGVVETSVRWQVEVLGAPTALPVVPENAVLRSLTVDGAAVPAPSVAGWREVNLQVGRHTIEASYIRGQADERFARQVAMQLPPGGPIRLTIRLPEPDVEPRLVGGHILAYTSTDDATLVTAELRRSPPHGTPVSLGDSTWSPRARGQGSSARGLRVPSGQPRLRRPPRRLGRSRQLSQPALWTSRPETRWRTLPDVTLGEPRRGCERGRRRRRVRSRGRRRTHRSAEPPSRPVPPARGGVPRWRRVHNSRHPPSIQRVPR